MKAVVFTPYSIGQLARFDISPEWFTNYFLPIDAIGLKEVVVDGIVYIIEASLDDDNCPLVAINLEAPDAIFESNKDNAALLERIRTVSDAQFSTSVKIPPPWRPYYEHNMLSIYAGTRFRGNGSRINFDVRPNGCNDLFVLAHTDEAVGFSCLQDMSDLHKQIRSRFTDAILDTAQPSNKNFRAGLN